MSGALMSLGTFVFSVPTLLFDQLKRRTDWRHARSPRVGARDASQFVGPGSDRISLDGQAVAELQDGRASLDELRDMAEQGGIWPLVDGAGYVYGAYVITSIDERSRHFLPDGTAMVIDFGIELDAVDDPSAEDVAA